MAKFNARTSSPSTTNKYWIKTTKGGLNECILISGDSCLPNCVGYAWGRWYELLGSRPKLSKGNAENWYKKKDGYKRGQTPKLGAYKLIVPLPISQYQLKSHFFLTIIAL